MTHRGRSHTRELVAGLFWPEMPESRARRRLSQTLWQIQSVLGEVHGTEPYVVATANSILFNSNAEYWLDVEAFEQGLQTLAEGPPSHGRPGELEALRDAVSLYRGDFLAGFYDEWVLVDQERLRNRHFAVLGRLVQLAKGHGDYEAALDYSRRIVMQDPLREAAHREIMRLCFLLGRTNEALQQYERCASILEEELGARPAPATVDLHREIVELREKGARPFTPAPRSPLFESARAIPFVGRTEERAAVIGQMEEALVGRGGVVLVEGEPGIGKTQLFEQLAEDAHWRGLGVLWGDCTADSVRPYEALSKALGEGLSPLRAEQLSQTVDGVWLREVSKIVPQIEEWLPKLPARAPLRAAEESDRMWEALSRTFVALGVLNPHVIFLDDLQWADVDTLYALVRLGEQLPESRVLFCISYRGEEIRERTEAWEAARRLDQMAGVHRIVLEPLASTEVTELVERATGSIGVATDFVEGLFYETGGNPLFILETLRAVHEATIYSSGSGDGLELSDAVQLPSGSVPVAPNISETIVRRLDALPPHARTVLDVIAVRGSLPPQAFWPESSLSRLETLAAIDELDRRRMIVETDNGYGFVHEQIRRVAYDTLDDGKRRSLHLAVAEEVEATSADRVEELAHHYSMAGVAEKALGYLRRAGERARTLHAYETAADHFGQAVSLAEKVSLPASELFELLGSYEQVLNLLGRRDEQESVIDAMIEIAPAELSWRTEAVQRKGWLLAHTDRFEEAEQAARSLLVLDRSSESRAITLTLLGMTMSWSGRPDDAIAHLEAAADLYEADALARADAQYALGNVFSDVQRYDEAGIHLERALAAYEELGEMRGQAVTLGVLGTIHAEQGRTDEAETRYQQALEISRSIGYRHAEAVNLGNLGIQQALKGRLGEALSSYEQAAAVFRSMHNRRGEAMVLANSASLLHSVVGDDERAATSAQAAREYFATIGHRRSEAQCLAILGRIARRQGQGRKARELLESGLTGAGASGDRWLEVQLRQSLAMLELDEGRPQQALERLDEGLDICRHLGLDDMAISLEAVRGLALLALGHADAAFSSTSRATAGVHPAIEQAYLPFLWHHRTAMAVGKHDDATAAISRAHSLLLAALDSLSSEQRRLALEGVPEHAAIVTAFEAATPTRRTSTIPKVDAPGGRPLRSDEWVEVMWTVDLPEDAAITDPVERRRSRLLRLMTEAAAQGGAPTVADLGGALGVGRTTINRDLAALRRTGHEISTRGSHRRRGTEPPTAG